MGVSLQKIDYHINKANDHLYEDLKDYLPLLLLFFFNDDATSALLTRLFKINLI
jgi:hypothetical protein